MGCDISVIKLINLKKSPVPNILDHETVKPKTLASPVEPGLCELTEELLTDPCLVKLLVHSPNLVTVAKSCHTFTNYQGRQLVEHAMKKKTFTR